MRLTLRVLNALPRATVVLLLIGVLVGGGLAYGLFVVQQRQYLEGRNYRLLTALASQIEGAIDSEARVFESLTRAVQAPPTPGPAPSGQRGVPPAARPTDALERPRGAGSSDADLRPWMYVKRRYAAGGVLPDNPPMLCDPKATYYLADDKEQIRLKIGLRSNPPPLAKASATRRSSCPLGELTLTLPLKPILEPIFTPKLAQNVFDTIALVTQAGNTSFVVGRRETELRSVPLSTLLQSGPRAETKPEEKKDGSAPAPVPLPPALVHTAVNDVMIGGVPYKLFTQPCCRYAGNAQPMMIVGLVEANAIKSQSWAISTTFVKIVVIVILLALVAWPFLKLTLLGERQRVRATDVFLVAASSVAALALLTVVGLDMSAYSRLNDDRDAQLAALAKKIKDNAQEEIQAALTQLHCLMQVSAPRTTPNMLVMNITYDEKASSCTGDLLELPAKSEKEKESLPSRRWPYPFFDSFTLIDDTGMQTRRLSTTAWTQSLLSVEPRRYFKDIKEERAWHGKDICKEGCAFESVWSWRSGEPQAVLSMKAPEESRAAVAALAIPMRSLIRPVLPPGFEFAVIGDDGAVLFHSDRHRNGFENFFRETDLNRRLRAQVVAHSAEPLDLRYWGAPYRAHVEPLGMFDLSVITLFQKEQAWALNREWLVVTLLFLTMYLMLWVIVLLVTLVPDASWVWPDAARQYRYFVAIGSYLLLLAAAVMAARHEQGTTLVWWGVGLPLVAWGVTFLLWRYRPSPAQGPRAHRPVYAHAVASVLLLVVSGVVPGVLLFLASFQLHVQSYVKHNGFRLAAAMSEQDRRLKRDYGKDRGEGRPIVLGLLQNGRLPQEDRPVQESPRHPELDRYYEFFYGTRIENADARTSPPKGCPPDATGDGDVLLEMLESHLPYYAESSNRMARAAARTCGRPLLGDPDLVRWPAVADADEGPCGPADRDVESAVTLEPAG